MCEAGVSVCCYDEVVEYFYAEYFACFGEEFCYFFVVVAWCFVSAWVVVGDDDRVCVDVDGCAEYFSWVYKAGVDDADAYCFACYDPVFTVEVEDGEDFFAAVVHVFCFCVDVFCCFEHRRLLGRVFVYEFFKGDLHGFTPPVLRGVLCRSLSLTCCFLLVVVVLLPRVGRCFGKSISCNRLFGCCCCQLPADSFRCFGLHSSLFVHSC